MPAIIKSPGDTFIGKFHTRSISGGIKDAGSLPSIIVQVDDTVDGTVSVSVTKTSTGSYTVTGTIPLTYTTGQQVFVIADAIVDGIRESLTILVIEIKEFDIDDIGSLLLCTQQKNPDAKTISFLDSEGSTLATFKTEKYNTETGEYVQINPVVDRVDRLTRV